MSQPTMSLLDILSPPGNRWLAELSRRPGDLPAGVRVVRFGGVDDDPAEDGEPPKDTKRQRPKQRTA